MFLYGLLLISCQLVAAMFSWVDTTVQFTHEYLFMRYFFNKQPNLALVIIFSALLSVTDGVSIVSLKNTTKPNLGQNSCDS